MSAAERDALYHRIPEGERIRNITMAQPFNSGDRCGANCQFALRCNRATVQRSDAELHPSEHTGANGANEFQRKVVEAGAGREVRCCTVARELEG